MPVYTVTSLGPKKTHIRKINYSKTTVEGIYPFRVKFTNIGVSIPPSQGIGVAVIGSTFVIL